MLAKRPPMGWNTWNTFGDAVNEEVILENVDAFVKLGLREAGYEYIVIDDCWSKKQRDPETGKQFFQFRVFHLFRSLPGPSLPSGVMMMAAASAAAAGRLRRRTDACRRTRGLL